MSTTSPRTGRTARIVPWVVAVVAAALAGYALLAPRLDGDAPSADSDSAAAEIDPGDSMQETFDELAGLARRDEGDPQALGDPDAPVVLIAYSEFQCPFCGKFARETEPALVESYVDTGVLRIEWRDFPYLGEESSRAADAGRAAGEQDKFWEYSDALFEDQPAPNSGEVDDAYLLDKAEQAGLDVARFQDHLGDPAHAQRIEADMDEGIGIGVSGTPSFLVNGMPLVGAQPLEVFEEAIEEAAQRARP